MIVLVVVEEEDWRRYVTWPPGITRLSHSLMQQVVNEILDSVAWEDLRKVLLRRLRMNQLWYHMQNSAPAFVAWRHVSRWDKNEASKCPNCGVHERLTISIVAPTRFATPFCRTA